MSLTVKKFDNKDLNISLDAFIDNKQNIWFQGKEIATLLGYECPRNAIRDHVDKDYKTEYKDLKGALIQSPPLNIQSNTIFIKEPGFYALIFRSKLESAKVFQN